VRDGGRVVSGHLQQVGANRVETVVAGHGDRVIGHHQGVDGR
jgi:hypothetical protein